MKMLRIRLCTQEEKDEFYRRNNLRKRKRIGYKEDDEEEEENEQEEEVEEEYQYDNEQPGPSTQNTSNQMTPEKRLLLVTCGNKKGFLDKDKLEGGEQCIKCEGRWLSPPAFEDYGGKGASKKWKATIFHGDKPLQFLFDEGLLTTKGFKRRATKTLPKKDWSSHWESENSSEESEIQSVEEDEVKDDDWRPGSEERSPEAEEEVENRGELIDSEEDKMEDDDMPAVSDREMQLNVTTPVKTKRLEVVVERLSEAKSGHLSNCTKHPVKVGPRRAPEEEEEEAQSDSTTKPSGLITDLVTSTQRASQCDSSDVTPTTEDDARNGEEFKQSNKEKKRENETEAGNSKRCSSATSRPSPGITPAEDTGSNGNRPANLRSSPQLFSLAGPSCSHGNAGSTDTTSSDDNAAQSEVMKLETCMSNKAQASKSTQTPDLVEHQCSTPSTRTNLDTMDLEQLKRVKIKMQLKVLQLQEEYYSLKRKELKN